MTAAPAPLPDELDGPTCDLCGSALPDDGLRCATCGLYRGGFVVPSTATIGRMIGAFVAVYLLTILIVLVAR